MAVDSSLVPILKSTDRNQFIPTDSCHHQNWLRSVPLSQFLRLGRNCTNIQDFEIQATILKNTFLEKGYSNHDLDQEIQKVCILDRRELFQPKSRNHNSFDPKWSFFTPFSIQHRQIKNIFNRHDVLKNDRIMGPLLPERADVICRGAPNLQMRTSSNIINSPSKPTFFIALQVIIHERNVTGAFIIHTIKKKTQAFTLNIHHCSYLIKPFVICATKNVVYLITCPCGKHYVGRDIKKISIESMNIFQTSKW